MNHKHHIKTWRPDDNPNHPVVALIYQLYPENLFEAHVKKDGVEVESIQSGDVERLLKMLNEKYASETS
jgi:hypothetical protein